LTPSDLLSTLSTYPPSVLYTLSLHDALPICFSRPSSQNIRVKTLRSPTRKPRTRLSRKWARRIGKWRRLRKRKKSATRRRPSRLDRKSTRLNSSHEWISYAVFCLKKKKKKKR